MAGLFSAHLAMSVKHPTMEAQYGWVLTGEQTKLLTASGAQSWNFLPQTAPVTERAIALEEVLGSISREEP